MVKNSKGILIHCIIVICLVLLASSCSKKKGAGSIYDIMPGKWQLTKYGSDDNLNGRIDHYEMHAVAKGSLYEMEYSGDGTGKQTNSSNSVKMMEQKFRWEFIAYDSLKISYDANDTITYHVLTSTAGSLGLTTTSKIENSNKVGIEYLFFNKL